MDQKQLFKQMIEFNQTTFNNTFNAAVLEKQMADLQKENRLLEQKMILKDLAAEFDVRSKDRTKKK